MFKNDNDVIPIEFANTIFFSFSYGNFINDGKQLGKVVLTLVTQGMTLPFTHNEGGGGKFA